MTHKERITRIVWAIDLHTLAISTMDPDKERGSISDQRERFRAILQHEFEQLFCPFEVS